MRRTAQPVDDSVLFDLPLVAEPELVNSRQTKPVIEATNAEQIELPRQGPAAEAEPSHDAHEDGETFAGTFKRRWVAGSVDLAVLAAALVVMVGGAAALGIRPALSDWPGYALVGLVLSFLYAGFSLLFWGKTPGMRYSGLTAASGDGSPLSIGQVLLRWLGGVGTVALLGLPTLLDVRGGGSLSDRISGSTLTVGG